MLVFGILKCTQCEFNATLFLLHFLVAFPLQSDQVLFQKIYTIISKTKTIDNFKGLNAR